MNSRALIIDLDAILHNVRVIKKITGKKVLACVKCNAYGMGVTRISKKIEKEVDWFGVATIDEAVSLRKAGIIKPILVMSPVVPSEIRKAIDHNITLTASSINFLKEIINTDGISIFLKFDTGMGRTGIMPEDTCEAIKLLRNVKRLKICGVFSHLSTSESPDKKFAINQIEIFRKILSAIPVKMRGITHIANSGGIVNLPESIEDFSMVRTGLLLYGVYPSLYLRIFKKIPSLKYAIKGMASVISVRDVPAGTSISYGRSFVCPEKTTIAVVGIGYGDGLNRSLSNKFYMKHHEDLYPIRGKICMDQSMIEIKKEMKEGQSVIFLDEQLSIEDMAEICHTVPHAIMTGFGVPRLKKVYIG